MVNLVDLNVLPNSVEDIGPLMKLHNLEEVDLVGNPLNKESLLGHIHELRIRNSPPRIKLEEDIIYDYKQVYPDDDLEGLFAEW